jgi:phenylacetate-coenzyme A ligase PaaK-like adenylate-forming protein
MTKRGVLLFGHWPVEVINNRFSNRYWLAPNLCDAFVQRALARTLVCHAPVHGNIVTFFYDAKKESRRNWIQTIKKKSFYVKGGVRGLPFPPVVRRNPAAISFAKHPIAAWPAFCRWALNVFRQGRALLGGRDLERFYRESPSWSIDELRHWQEKKLKEVLFHAATTVPHFKTLLSGFTPEHFSMERFRSLPFMERQDIARRPDQYISSDIKTGTTISTSGTSGHPLTIHVDMETLRHREAAQRRGREWWGFYAGDRYAKLFGRISPQRLPRRIRERWFENRVLLNAYAVTPAAMFRWYETLCKKSFSYIYGYASVASELAREWIRRGFFLPTGWIGGIILTADLITEEQQQKIEQIFGAPIIREYGSTEFHVIAMECPDGGWHLEADRLFVEFLDDAGQPARPFEPARIVITALDALRMPFIRYPLSDVGSYSDRPCVCGRSLPLLHTLAGRDVSTLRLPTGGLSHSGLFSVLIEAAHHECDHLCPPWQAVQRSQDNIEIFLVEKLPSANVEEAIRRRMKQVDPLFNVTFSYVDALPATPGGKRNRFIELAPL